MISKEWDAHFNKQVIGQTLGSYEILSPLGKGGMGEVWRARDQKLGREIAIKTLPEEFAKDEERLARFEREAKLLASLNHPNIAAIYGLEEHEGTRFLVLELVEGDTLADQLKRGAIPVEESLQLALQIAEALEAAHEKGVIHRDLKPANIKVTPDDKIKVLDFGLAKALMGDGADVSLSHSPTLSIQATAQGVILGTAAYMSPEQARGQEVDKRADVWAFGVVLFEMLTGRGTFDGGTVSDVLAGVLAKEPHWNTLPSNLHPRIRLLLERCLEKEARDRYHDIADVRVDIQTVLADPSGVLVQPVDEGVQAAPQSKLPWVAAIIFGIVAGVAGWSLKPNLPGPVSRFSHVLPEGQQFTNTNRTVVALSPDGSRMVYVANQQLYVRAMDTLDSSPIPGTDENPTAPFFSPDGQWIGYWSQVDRQLKKIALGGGAPVVLTDIGNPYGAPQWSADDTIVWSQATGVMRASVNGGTPELLIAASGEIIILPQILRDGDSVLFHVGTSTAGEIAVQSLESGDRKVLFPGTHPRYVPTGHLVYNVDGVLFAVPFDIDSLEATGGPVSLVEGIQTVPTQYAVSDSGSLAYVPAGSAVNDWILALVDLSGLVEPLNVPPNQYRSPSLSPDGRQLAVETTGELGSNIWVYDLSETAAIRQLTQSGDNTRPIWTPDGERVTFTSDREGTSSIYWQRADGSSIAERLTTAEEGTEHSPESWSPDGRTLSVARATGDNRGIWTLSLDAGAQLEQFHDLPESLESGSRFSPDGRWLAYHSGESFIELELYAQPFPATGVIHRITQEGGARPVWSPDGRQLFYRRTFLEAAVAPRLMTVDIATDPRFIFSNERTLPIEGFLLVSTQDWDYDITPEGDRFVMLFPVDQTDSAQPTGPQINVVLNWLEELAERAPVP